MSILQTHSYQWLTDVRSVFMNSTVSAKNNAFDLPAFRLGEVYGPLLEFDAQDNSL